MPLQRPWLEDPKRDAEATERPLQQIRHLRQVMVEDGDIAVRNLLLADEPDDGSGDAFHLILAPRRPDEPQGAPCIHGGGAPLLEEPCLQPVSRKPRLRSLSRVFWEAWKGGWAGRSRSKLSVKTDSAVRPASSIKMPNCTGVKS